MSFNQAGNSFQRNYPIVFNLIIINVIVFFAQNFLPKDLLFSQKIALYPYATTNFKLYQIITYMFAHGGIAHILFNMFNLYFFGTILERAWGSKVFLQFYLLFGIAAGIAHLVITPGAVIGASGAVMGCIGAAAYLFPNTQLITFLPFPIPIKLKYEAIIIAGMDLFGAFNPTGSNIAHWAHLGGLITGIIVAFIFNKINKKTFY
jgi:membrane associated rhomboid family serine protease